MTRQQPEPSRSRLYRLPRSPNRRDYLRSIGPGLVSGAADIDPTTVGTMAVIGATTVYDLSWLALLVFPVLAVILAISARVGVVTHCDLQGCVKRQYGRSSRLILLGGILAVNIVTIAADLEAGAAALGLLFHIDWRWFVCPLAVALVALLLLGAYDEVQHVLKWVLLCLLAYVVAAFLARPQWGLVLRHSLVPTFRFTSEYTAAALALLGTTLTGYVYVWQTIEESEEAAPLEWLRAREAGASAGIFFGVGIFWFILVATGATLGVHHEAVESAQQAAQALRPVAGPLASYVFGTGLLASAVVALPVILATSAYVVGAEFDWERGLSEHVRHAPRFYAVIAVAMLAGVGLAFSGVSPIRLLFISSIIGGLGTPISLMFLMLVAGNDDLMAGLVLPPALKAAGWLVAALVTLVSLVYLTQLVLTGA